MAKVDQNQILKFLINNYESHKNGFVLKKDLFEFAKINFKDVNEVGLYTSIGCNIKFINDNYSKCKSGYKGIRVRINHLFFNFF